MRSRVGPVRVRVRDSDLQTIRLRGVGFRADCACGWQSDRDATYAEARAQLWAHRAAAHAPDEARATS